MVPLLAAALLLVLGSVGSNGLAVFTSKADIRSALLSWQHEELAAYRALMVEKYGEIDDWNVSAVTDMSGLFENLESFNFYIGSWDTSAVTNMSAMFHNAYAFNQPIGSWDTSAVRDMRAMFAGDRQDVSGNLRGAPAFNQPLGAWNTSAVIDMSGMFRRAAFFDQPLGAWDTSAVKDMSRMFQEATKFNQPIGTWDTSAVLDMEAMFHSASSFNQRIETWDTSAVVDMRTMFAAASRFNQFLGAWDTSSVTDMTSMFEHADAFNQPIGAWDTSSVRDMSSMFFSADAFNQPIGAWDTSAVRDMSYMFYFYSSSVYRASAFNQPIGAWDTSAVRDMSYMFYGASAFNQPLGAWDTSAVRSMADMFSFEVACSDGQIPTHNLLGCEACSAGTYSKGRARSCSACGKGSVPVANRSTCEDCPAGHYSPADSDLCQQCHLPWVLLQDDCIWWHLPLLAVTVVSILVGGRLLSSCKATRRAAKMESIKSALYQELWEDVPDTIDQHVAKLKQLGVTSEEVARWVADARASQSERAGVGLRYLLSTSFAELAAQRTGLADPTFVDMKQSFWLEKDPIGQNLPCPRDGRPGCALVDWIPRPARHEQTHFMSWTWKYSLGQMRSALEVYGKSLPPGQPDGVFFFMCFFVNNQFRIIVEKSMTGSAKLEEVFEGNLTRIGRMIAILDTWEQPTYLTRVWTVYEQFVASKLQIPVTFVMPTSAATELQQHISRGAAGIHYITDSVSGVDSARATAWDPRDEAEVKSLIESTVGFQHVDLHITNVMEQWIGEVVRSGFGELINESRRKRKNAHEVVSEVSV